MDPRFAPLVPGQEMRIHQGRNTHFAADIEQGVEKQGIYYKRIYNKIHTSSQNPCCSAGMLKCWQ